MEKELVIFPCGTICKLNISGIVGTITCISVRYDTVSYEVTYYVNHTYNTIWVNEKEFKTQKDCVKTKIFFRNE